MAKQQKKKGNPAPRSAPERGELPHPLTFFLSEGERRAVLARLRAVARDRAAALCVVLEVERTGVSKDV
ncbi:MAG: hypothetical protein KDA20_08190 [Phycisphaerales bacterium]|nr:hypothetical protein [Phycisphaerales bacterium]